jgi:predicted ribosomally synthesized peptide with nif11-like leader
MSIESAKAFLERLQNDEDFRKAVGEIATAEERMEFVKGAGFDFTKEEIKSDQVELREEDKSFGVRMSCGCEFYCNGTDCTDQW